MNEERQKEVFKELQRFFDDTPFVLFGSGMSMAVNEEYGVEALGKHLREQNISEWGLNYDQEQKWNLFVENIEKTKDLESAMDAIGDELLIRRIVESTAQKIAELDKMYGRLIWQGEREWPAATLLQKIVNNLPENNPVLHVATTNYDMLAEYSFEKMGIIYVNGFYGNIIKRQNWGRSLRLVEEFEKIRYKGKTHLRRRMDKHIRLYKIHGSLNMFKYGNEVVEGPTCGWIWDEKEGFERLMITPGMSKYREVLMKNRDLLSEFDKIVKKSNKFLFLGFGFNDDHWVSPFQSKLCEQKCSGIIITKKETNGIKKFFSECKNKNLWLIVEGDKLNETKIYNSLNGLDHPYLVIENQQIWKPNEFCRRILGG